MTDRPKRKRIPVAKKGSTPVIEDSEEFKKNKCSPNARKVRENANEIEFDIWVDKHLHIRQQFGDENGKMDGIEPMVVEALVIKAFNYLLYFSSLVKGFAFINNDKFHNPPIRVLLKEQDDSGLPLNVLIEAHSLGLNKYELTIITALRTDEFRMADGQYMVEFQEDTSVLKKKTGNIFNEIFEFNL
jgi:hypothetical protein